MARMGRKRSCWEMMRCADGNCLAYKNQEVSCWELARERNHLQSVYGICADCIVYLSQREPPVFTDRQLDEILSHEKVRAGGRGKCPLVLGPELIREREDRRLVGRFRTKEPVTATVVSRAERQPAVLSGRVVDVCRLGLSFSCLKEDGRWGGGVRMDIRGRGFELTGLPGTVVSEVALGDGAAAPVRRCGVRFAGLSPVQQGMLEEMLQRHCRPLSS